MPPSRETWFRLAPWGAREMHLVGWPLVALTVATAWFFPWLVPLPIAALIALLGFFRDPPRHIPQEQGLVVSPADGKVVEITRLDHDEFIGGPAVRIGIFLSVLNVHVNRAPVAARVIETRYAPGKFLDARRPECSKVNESMWIGLEEAAAPHRRLVVRQISGAIARRIVCAIKAGQVLPRGYRFGMIKFGSRTELILPEAPELRIAVAIGDRVRGGASVVARFEA